MTQLEFQTAAKPSQCDRILARLREAHGGWVSLPELARVSNAYAIPTRVSNLRRREGHNIENRLTLLSDGTKASEYRLVE